MGDFLFGESFFLKEPYRKTFIVCDGKKRSCVAGFGLRCLFAACSSSVLHTLIAARPAVFFSLPLFKQRKTPGAAFPPPGGLLIVAYFFTVFWAMPRIWEIVQPYSLQVTTLPQ